MTTTLQRVRQLQEEIRAREEMLQNLAQTPEYLAEQEFIKDLQDVLEMHGRTLREAIMAIDPGMLGTVTEAKPKRPYKPRKAKDVESFSLNDKPPAPAPKVSPFANFGMAAVAATNPESPQELLDAIGAPAQPSAKPNKPAKRANSTRRKSSHNATRNAARRIECIKNGTWFLYTNPHTQESEEASGARTDTLRAWVAEYGKVVVEGWKRPITPEEAGL
jgi:hypothetical protein